MPKRPLISPDMKESARFVCDSIFWKHLERMMVEIDEDERVKLDNVRTSEDLVMAVAEGRGVRKVIKAIHDELEQHLV